MRLSKNGVAGNIVRVLLSNITTVIAGVVIGFVVPKILSVEGYGFYKTFTLYITYTGLFSLGIIDGIVLEYGGVEYEDYDYPYFRGVFRWYVIINALWAVAVACLSFFTGDTDYTFIVCAIAVYLFFANVVGFFQQISQITQRFREFSSVKIVQSVFKLLGGLIMFALSRLSPERAAYRLYIALIIAGMAIIAFSYCVIYKKMIFGPANRLGSMTGEILRFSRIGFPLLFANLCATLILTLDRQFVNVLFTNREYAVYAFAYNLLSIVTVATSAVSIVLYPMMKRSSTETLTRNYSVLIGVMLSFVNGALIAYFPLKALIGWYLPRYVDSLVIFRVIFPGLVISSAITVVMHNYYKTLGDSTLYFKKSVLILIVSGVANAIAYVLFRTTVSISIASVVTMILWYLYIEQYFVDKCGYSRKQNLAYLLSMMVAFYLVTCIENWIVSGVIYLAVYLALTLFMERDVLGFIRRRALF